MVNPASINKLRQEIRDFLNFKVPELTASFTTHESIEVEEDGYRRLRISYISEEGDEIPAYLLLPKNGSRSSAVLIHHQHASQRHFGKSEVCGLVGDPLQAFGPALAKQGLVVLAPDSICFEDRRKNRTGTEPDVGTDIAQHMNETSYRLVRGDTLMRKVLSDSALGISILRMLPEVDRERIGILGHSYGGNTVLFHAALDERIRFACSSGAACSYKYKMANNIGIEAAEIIPGFAAQFEIQDLIACFTPRKGLILSATEDKYSQDADAVILKSMEICKTGGLALPVEHLRYSGGHSLTQERFNAVVEWFIKQM